MAPQRRLERVDLGGDPRRRLGAEMPGLAAAAALAELDTREERNRASRRRGVV